MHITFCGGLTSRPTPMGPVVVPILVSGYTLRAMGTFVGTVYTVRFLTYWIVYVISQPGLSAYGGSMDKSVVTVKGQVVIPSKLRRKFGIKKGTQVYLYERGDEIVIRPLTDEYLRSLAGIIGTKGKLLKALMEDKAKEREL